MDAIQKSIDAAARRKYKAPAKPAPDHADEILAYVERSLTPTTAPRFSPETGVCIQCIAHTHRLCLGVPCKCARCSSPGGHADPNPAPLARYTTETHARAVRRAIRALGVITKTPHIAAYLAQHDPQAYRQAKNALHSFTDAEIEEATAQTTADAPQVDAAICKQCGHGPDWHVMDEDHMRHGECEHPTGRGHCDCSGYTTAAKAAGEKK